MATINPQNPQFTVCNTALSSMTSTLFDDSQGNINEEVQLVAERFCADPQVDFQAKEPAPVLGYASSGFNFRLIGKTMAGWQIFEANAAVDGYIETDAGVLTANAGDKFLITTGMETYRDEVVGKIVKNDQNIFEYHPITR